MNEASSPSPRILLVRFGAMGDIIHSMPAAAALRRALPAARIDWLVEARWRDLLQPSPNGLLDHVITIDTFRLRQHPVSPASWSALRGLIAELRTARYDIAVDLQGAIKSGLSCRLSGAGRVYGFAAPWLRESPAALFHSRKLHSTASHIVEANLEMARMICRDAGLPAPQSAAEFPLPAGDRAALSSDWSDSDYAVMNPGAGWPSKRWLAESFAALCDELQQRYGWRTVLNCGPGEAALAGQVISACRVARPGTFSGAVPAMIALLRGARLMVGPDTGPLHMAAALGVPTVGIYGPTDPARNGPYGPRVRALRMPGARTSHRRSEPSDGSISAISPAMVLDSITELLAGQPAA